MKKILSVLAFVICTGILNFCSANFQSENNFDLNKNLNSQLRPVSVIFSGIVKVQTYLSLREQPNINSREIMRIPNGATVMFRESRLPNEWLEVISVNFDGKEYSTVNANRIGYVHSKYIQIDYHTGS